MKASFKTILFLLFASSLLGSCTEKCGDPTITPITESDAEWLVYDTPDTIKYTSNTKETVKFVLSNAFTEQIPGEGYSVTDDCIDKQDTQAGRIIQNVSQKWPGMATYVIKRPNNLIVSLVLQGNGSFEIDENNPTYPTLPINGLNYKDVFEIKKDTSSTTKVGDVKQILFNKENGYIKVVYFGGKSIQLQ
ncbi:hypothetical protein ACSX1A_02640 [Pontibacter sp. MBLB2868]|uniref:hypothetical protein n=1 Tax=Pontibacter sp. MBLB2868 TaxID=3451555 RepID=UPI003F74B3AB